MPDAGRRPGGCQWHPPPRGAAPGRVLPARCPLRNAPSRGLKERLGLDGGGGAARDGLGLPLPVKRRRARRTSCSCPKGLIPSFRMKSPGRPTHMGA